MGIRLRKRRTGASGAVGCGSNAEATGRLKISRRRYCEPAQRVWQFSSPNGVPILDRFPLRRLAVAMTGFSWFPAVGASGASPLFRQVMRKRGVNR
jgi:hypothetical protein